MNIYFLCGVVTGMGVAGLMFVVLSFLHAIPAKPKQTAGESLASIFDEAHAQQMPGELSKPATNFSVTGKPRAVPWHIRRKELEAKARTKRKRLESFQEHI